MERAKALMQHPIVWLGLAAVVVILLGGAAGGLYVTQQVPPQPIQFPHNFHVGVGLSCQYCHPGVAWGPEAGLPSSQKCWGCHQQIAKQSPELDKLRGFVESGEEIPWVPVAIQPDFVHFNHRPHIAAGLNCESCHGDLSTMTVAEPQSGQNMGWCLDCHQKMQPDDFTRLSDCALCHY